MSDNKKLPTTVFELSQVVLGAVNRLVNKETSVNEVKAIIAGINSVQAGLALRQEQARLSGARVNGDVIMDLKFNPNDEPSPASQIIDEKKPALKMLKGTKSPKRRKSA